MRTWRRVRSWLCVLFNGSHELYRVRTGTRLHQRCLLCGHETHGWDCQAGALPCNQKTRTE